MKSCTIITCNNCEFYNTQYCKNCSKEGDDCYEHWEWRHDISWRQEQIDNLTQTISDLEAKLAVSENTITNLVEDNRASQEWYKKQLAEKDQLLNQYPYKNDVIEKQYEDLKDGIKFRIENNITDDWEQLYHCIDVLCEKHKARIRDIEDGICKIEQLELLLKAKEKMKTQSLKGFEKLKQQLAESESRFQAHKQNDARIIQDQTDLIENLKQQLDDTEEQNKRVLEKLELIVSANQELEQKLAEKEEELAYMTKQAKKFNNEAQKYFEEVCCKETTQDKISFAVEQLEKVKEGVNKTNENGYLIRFANLDERLKFYKEIDNQIKQLKEMK